MGTIARTGPFVRAEPPWQLHKPPLLSLPRAQPRRFRLPGAMNDAGGDDPRCVVCAEAPREVVFTACGHCLLCERCTVELIARGQPCPCCRLPVRAVGGTRGVEPVAGESGALAPLPSFMPETVDPVATKRARERPQLVVAAAAAEAEEEYYEEEEEEEEEEQTGGGVRRGVWADSVHGQHILQRLRDNDAALTTLDLSSLDLDSADMTPLAACLATNTTVTSLALGINEGIGNEGLATLGKCFERNKTLKYLDLPNTGIDDRGVTQLGFHLCIYKPALTGLVLSHDIIEGSESLPFLCMSSILTTLDLAFLDLSDQVAAGLASALEFNATLTSLNLASNNIGDEGATKLARCLRLKNNTLKCLDLDSNKIGVAGAMQLSECLRINTALKSLCLSSNRIGDAGATRLARCLCANKTLTNLRLGHNRISNAVVTQLAECQRAGATLENLYLDGNVGAEGTAQQDA